MQRRPNPPWTLFVVVTTLFAGGCSQPILPTEFGRIFKQKVEIADHSTVIKPAGHQPARKVTAVPSVVRPAAAPKSPTSDIKNLWETFAHSLTFVAPQRVAVRREVMAYRGQRKFLRETSARAAPFLYYILQETKRLGIPPDLALLPILESGYQPAIISPYGAAGLWQFMAGTSNTFGLQQTAWRDDRLDVVTSTAAALEYLDALHVRFDGDWLLAIAAYNAGWGNVERAVAQNQRAGLATDVWSLPLTAETHRLLARFLALVEIYRRPTVYGLTLEPLPAQAYFTSLELRKPTDLRRLIQLANIDEQTFRILNPGFKGWHTGPISPRKVQVPASALDAAIRVAAQLAPSSPPTETADASTARPSIPASATRGYAAKRGDSLWVIARRFDTRVAQLERLNGISRNHPLRIGQRIAIPRTITPHPAIAKRSVVRYRVRPGDSLWTISRQFKVTISDLVSWNKLAASATLQLGQELLVYRTG
jgi:membrane-bound lytic murein transglycosylase D